MQSQLVITLYNIPCPFGPLTLWLHYSSWPVHNWHLGTYLPMLLIHRHSPLNYKFLPTRSAVWCDVLRGDSVNILPFNVNTENTKCYLNNTKIKSQCTLSLAHCFGLFAGKMKSWQSLRIACKLHTTRTDTDTDTDATLPAVADTPLWAICQLQYFDV